MRDHKMEHRRRRGHWKVGVLGIVASACLIGASTGVQATSVGTPIHLNSVTMESTTPAAGASPTSSSSIRPSSSGTASPRPLKTLPTGFQPETLDADWSAHLVAVGGYLNNQWIVYVTPNQGRSWRRFTPPRVPAASPTGANPRYPAVNVLAPGYIQMVWVSHHRVWTTTTANDGRTWHEWSMEAPTGKAAAPYTVAALDFVTPLDGWMMIHSLPAMAGYSWSWLYRTTNGGRTWQTSGLRAGGLSGRLEVTSAATTWAFFENHYKPGHLYRVTDGGTRWQRVPLPMSAKVQGLQSSSTGPVFSTTLPRAGLIAIAYAPAHLGVHLAWDRTTDGGQTWQRVIAVKPWSPGSVAATVLTNPQTAFVLAQSRGTPSHQRWYETTDGTRQWEAWPYAPFRQLEPIESVGPTLASGSRTLWAIIYRSGHHGHLASRVGEVVRTTDGGHHWATY